MELSNSVKISTVSSICLVGLVVVLKNILNVPAEILSKDIVLYIIIYSLFGWIMPSINERKERIKEKQKNVNAKYWYLVIIFLTLAIIGVYALKIY